MPGIAVESVTIVLRPVTVIRFVPLTLDILDIFVGCSAGTGENIGT